MSVPHPSLAPPVLWFPFTSFWISRFVSLTKNQFLSNICSGPDLLTLCHGFLKVVYVGSAEDSARDQVLDEILVGPVPVGVNKFVLQSDAPDPKAISDKDILGVTVVLVTCSYREKEFIRVGYYLKLFVLYCFVSFVKLVWSNMCSVPAAMLWIFVKVGYYVNNEYSDEYDADAGPPQPLEMSKVVRTILADKPRVTRFQISWTNSDKEGELNEESKTKEVEMSLTGEESRKLQDSDSMVTDEWMKDL